MRGMNACFSGFLLLASWWAVAAPGNEWTYHQVVPERCVSFHRCGVAGPLIRIQGFSAQVADPAFNPRLDRYNRYQSYGTVMPDNILPTAGWDWSLWPGATTQYLLPEALEAEVSPLNGMSFVGGSHLESRHGVYAMRFHDKAFDTTFWFNKSVFAFGDVMICLGSDIENHDYLHRTVTTLFQVPLTERTAPIRVNDVAPVESFPYEAVLAGETTTWLMDPMGIGYVVPAGQRVQVARRTQLSVNDMGTREESGDFATAWLDHGRFPLGAGYEYVILLDRTPEAVAAYAAKPEHEVLTLDKNAHIVRHAGLGLTGYAMFRRESFIPDGPVLGVDRACLVLVEEAGETMRISVCDPDLRPRIPAPQVGHGGHGAHGAPAAQSDVNEIRLVLRGKWDFAADEEPGMVRRTDLRPDTATFVFAVAPGLPTETVLKKRP